MADDQITVTKKEANKEQGIVIQNIVIRPVVRSSQDIEKWRNALRAAEGVTPERIQLYDLYADIILDSFLSSLIEKRVLGVTKRKLSFVDKSGKGNEQIIELIKTQQFRKLRTEIIMQKLFGIKVIEIDRLNDGIKVFSAPVKHIKPWLGVVSYEQYGYDGIEYNAPPANKYVFQVGDSHDLGLLLKAAPYVIYKRGGFGDWAHFAEIFGTPFREARYDGFNPQVRAQLELALERAGNAAYAVLPKEAEITFHEPKNVQGNGQLYDMLRKACNEELSVLILGQTETTTSSQSSGYAQAKEHAKVEDAFNLNDCEDELGILNECVKPILANLGFNVDGDFIHEEETEEMSMLDKASMYDILRNNIKLPVSDDHLYKEFSIPKPDNYDEQKAELKAAAQAQSGNPDDEPDDDPEPQKPKQKNNAKKSQRGNLSAWDKLRARMIDFFDQAPRD